MKQKLSLVLMLSLISFAHLFAQEVLETTDTVQPEFMIDEVEQVVTINNENFEKFLNGIVQDALKYGKQALLSQALLRCYECMMHDQKEVYMNDLQEALPELLGIAAIYCQEQNEARAPRPGQHFQENEIVGPGTCDLSSVVQLLHQLLTALNKCCSILQSDFQQTWTILANLNLSATTVVDLSVIFTIIADIDATLTACCENITREFQETWTILANLSVTVSSSPCNATPILTPTTISLPGFYCLANDIIGTLTITADNVSVNLNNHTISAPGTSAILINGNRNVIVENGKIDNASIGVELVSTETVELTNLLITNCSTSGIRLSGINSATRVEDVIIDTCSTGVSDIGSVRFSLFSRIIIRNTASPFSIGGRSNIAQDIQVIDCGSSAINATGIFVSGSENSQIINCSVINFQGQNGISISSRNSLVKSCIVQNLFSGRDNVSITGILLGNDTIVLQDSSVINVQSSALIGGSAAGIRLDLFNTTLENCFVQTCSSISDPTQAFGIYATNAIQSSNFINCSVYNAGYGFNMENGGSSELTFLNCEAAYNSLDGFFINNITTLLGECVAFNNGAAGFNIAAVGTTPMYSCFASGNGTDYINAPNVQNANTTVGVFARGNNFI